MLQTRGEDFQILLRKKETQVRPPPGDSGGRRGTGRGSGWGGRGGKGGKGGKGEKGGKGRNRSFQEHEWHLDVVCLRAAHPFAFATSEAKAVLLASGTLAPFESLAQELGVTISENDSKPAVAHVEDSTLPADMDLVGSTDVIWNGGARVCVAPPEPRACVVSSADHHRGIDRMVLRVVVPEYNRMKLRLTQRLQSDHACLDNLSGAILQCARSIRRGGVLVFFPSYKMLETWSERSKSNGCLAAFEESKRVFVEEKSLSGDDFQRAITDYKDQAERSASSPTEDGAIFFAVMRGWSYIPFHFTFRRREIQ